MFLDFYRLHQQPFGVTPDPAFLYPSLTHCAAARRAHGGNSRGAGFLTPDRRSRAWARRRSYIKCSKGCAVPRVLRSCFQTQCNSREFFQYLLSELGVDSTGMGLSGPCTTS